MPEPETFLLFVRALNRSGIRYMLTGSVAAIFYGEPRLTHDVDFVVSLDITDFSKLPNAFPATDFYLPPPDVIATEARRESRGHFNIIHLDTGFKADMYLTGSDDLNAWGFKRRREFRSSGESVTLAPPEYVILRKLEYYREGKSEKHLRDIRSILNVSGESLDREALKVWIARSGLHAEWDLLSS